MKELIDNTHSGAYSPQSHSDGYINTHSCTQTGNFTTIYRVSEKENTWGKGWPLVRGRTKVMPLKTSDHLV